jgi:hypothetical protein
MNRRNDACAQYGYLGTSLVIWVPVRSFGKNDSDPKEWRKAGAKRAEGEIKGCGLFALKSLGGLGVSLDTTGGVYPRDRASLGPASSFLVAGQVDA